MAFNYSKLLGKIKEQHLTQEQLAEKIGITSSTLNLKLNNKAVFTAKEIEAIRNVLGMTAHEIGAYFFCQISSEIQNF